MNLEPFTGPGSTPSRRRFWDKVTQAVIASQKIAGRNVTCDEHPGKGTVINVNDTSSRRRPPTPPTTGACCIRDGCLQLTESDCASAGGVWHEGQHCTDGTCPCGSGHCGTPTPCTTCDPSDFFAPFTDGMTCYTTLECDGSPSGPVPCDSLWATLTQTCEGEDFSCSEICNVASVDPITCTGSHTGECDDCVNGTGLTFVSNQMFICPELSPPP